MQAADRELWLLNFYRNSELHGALLMGKLARVVRDTALQVNLTKHCATEAKHASMLTEAIAALGADLNPDTGTIQEHYSAEGGVPKEMIELLVLSETLEKRVLASYRAHLQRTDVSANARAVLAAIVLEMEEEADHEGWIEERLENEPPEKVQAAEKKWREIDEMVAKTLEASVGLNIDRRGALK